MASYDMMLAEAVARQAGSVRAAHRTAAGALKREEYGLPRERWQQIESDLRYAALLLEQFDDHLNGKLNAVRLPGE